LAGLGPLGAVLGTALHTVGNALGIQSAADDVVTNAGRVLNTAAADHDHGVLLQVVANTGNISGHFVAVGQTHTGDLTESGVRLLRGGGTNSGAHTSLLGRRQVGLAVLQGVQALLHSRRIGLVGHGLASLANELVKRRHGFPPFFVSEKYILTE